MKLPNSGSFQSSMEVGGLSSFKEPYRTVATNQVPALDASTSDSPRSKPSLAISNRSLCFSLARVLR